MRRRKRGNEEFRSSGVQGGEITKLRGNSYSKSVRLILVFLLATAFA